MSDLQSGISVENGAVTGTLKYVSTGALATDWGPGNFVALEFVPSAADTAAGANTYRVGLKPSVSSGILELDSDMDAVLRVTDKDAQVLVVETVGANGATLRQEYDLSGLTCEGGD